MDRSFWKGKRVFITGHTGFKGTWLCSILVKAGAVVTGYSLPPSTNPDLFSLCRIGQKVRSHYGDIRNLNTLMEAFKEASPEIVFHLAAQPIVRESYKNPVYTYETNVMGAVNILECVRVIPGVRSFLNVTTDKVYLNNEWCWGYRETDTLDGFDPYSNSKSCSELVTHSYKNSFFLEETAISTARAGNVIGGGDFSKDRIIPDCVRSAQKKETIMIRNPRSVRPYQHVLEPLFAYIMIVEKQYAAHQFAGSYNVGPDDNDCLSTSRLVEIFCKIWGEDLKWKAVEGDGPHEAGRLKLDCSKLKATFNWVPTWTAEQAVHKVIEWTKAFFLGGDISFIMSNQIEAFENDQ